MESDFQAMSPDSDDDEEEEDTNDESNFFGSGCQIVSQEQQQPIQEEFPVNDVATPKASAFMKIRTADKVNIEEEDSDE